MQHLSLQHLSTCKLKIVLFFCCCFLRNALAFLKCWPVLLTAGICFFIFIFYLFFYIFCLQGDVPLSSNSLQQILEESRQVIMASSERNSSTHLSSVLNSCPTLSSVTADQLHSHKCQTSHHCPASLTQKVEKCYDSASTFFSFHLSSWGVVTIKGVKCLVELFLFVVWVCWDIAALFSSLFNRLLKLHPKPALDTSQTRGRLDSNRSADCLLKWTLQNVPKILKLVLQVKIAIQLTSGKY